jgi:aspartate kinase
MVIVCKFGGTSVGSAPAMREAAAIVEQTLPQAPLVVLSAMAGTTDGLFRAARLAERGQLAEARAELETIFERHRAAAAELVTDALPALREELDRHRDELEVLLHGVSLLRELTRRTLDAIVGHGELLSSVIFVRLLERRGTPVDWFDVRRVLRTDVQFGAAAPQRSAIAELCRTELLPLLVPERAVVTQGYLGATEQGHATTLGRGGSDYSATLLGAAVAASEVQIWTDVEGVLTADPRVVPDARPIAALTFAEAAEMAAFGAKVLHPATIQPAVEAGIPVTVRHTGRPRGRHTRITGERSADRKPEALRAPVTALCSRGPLIVLTLTSARMFDQSGYLARVFEVFGRLGVSVDLVATAEVSVSCTVDADAPVDKLAKELLPYATVEVARDRALVSVIGERLKSAPYAVRDTFAALGDIVPELISLGGNEINLSFVVPHAQARNAVRALHRAFFQPAPADAAAEMQGP